MEEYESIENRIHILEPVKNAMIRLDRQLADMQAPFFTAVVTSFSTAQQIAK